MIELASAYDENSNDYSHGLNHVLTNWGVWSTDVLIEKVEKVNFRKFGHLKKLFTKTKANLNYEDVSKHIL